MGKNLFGQRCPDNRGSTVQSEKGVMSSSSDRNRVRHSLVVAFDSPAARAAFKSRIERVRSMLTPEGQPNFIVANFWRLRSGTCHTHMPHPSLRSNELL